jgi:hypothetical protein
VEVFLLRCSIRGAEIESDQMGLMKIDQTAADPGIAGFDPWGTLSACLFLTHRFSIIHSGIQRSSTTLFFLMNSRVDWVTKENVEERKFHIISSLITV